MLARAVRMCYTTGMDVAIRLRIQEVREAHGLTQAQLAKKARVARATVNRYEQPDHGGVDFATLEKLADALDVNAVALLVHDRKRAL